MHLTVGYLATPTGDDGVALAVALATTFEAEVDVVPVVREEMPDGHPGRAAYQQFWSTVGKPGSRPPPARAVPTRTGADNPLSLALTLASASASALPIRLLSLVPPERLDSDQSSAEARQAQIAAAEQNLVVAARLLPDSPDIQSLVADGSTLESALRRLSWGPGDLLLLGSGRFATPGRMFLGSTGARILAAVDVPVVVVPRR
jgi:nucleotide-binding universal stress UspA family protein